jgi:Putative zinc-finger
MLSHEEALERDWAAQYVLGELAEPERDRFEEHLFDCPACAESVRNAYFLLRGVEATLKHPLAGKEQPAATPASQPRVVRPIWRRPILALPYAAILCLSLGAGAQYIALQKARAPQAIVSFAVAPQAKGAAYAIRLPREGQFVELRLDLVDAAPLYHWEIRSGGTTKALMSGQARVPANAVALSLLLPTHKLHPGRYEVVVATPAGGETFYPIEIAGEPGAKSNL